MWDTGSHTLRNNVMQAGVIGLGALGIEVADRLREADLLRAIHAANPIMGSDWPEMSPSADAVMASCEVVFIEGTENLLPLIANLETPSSTSPIEVLVILGAAGFEDLARIDELAATLGIAIADCGLAGTIDEGAVFVGGRPEAFALLQPVMESLSSVVIHCGVLGTANAMKVSCDVMRAGQLRASYESARLAEAAGVLPEAIARISPFGGACGGPGSQSNCPADLAQILRAQVADALALGTRLGVSLPVAQLAAGSAAQLFGLSRDIPPIDAGPVARGLAVFEQVYGPGTSRSLVGSDRSDFAVETISHLFGEIWSRPNLSIRDRRLLLIGVTATLGREDLILVQATAALVNNELTETQLDEMVLFLAFYVGWCNSGPLYSGVLKAKQQFQDKGVEGR